MDYVEEKNGEDATLLLVSNDTNRGQENTWYLDTCASNHMSKSRSMFVKLKESVNSNVAFRDQVPIKGKGSILFHVKNGSH